MEKLPIKSEAVCIILYSPELTFSESKEKNSFDLVSVIVRHVTSTKHTEPSITFLLWQLNFHLHLETLQFFSVWVIRKGHVSIVKTLKREEEPQCVKTYLLTCAPNEDSNQPVHPRSLISLRCSHEESLHPWISEMRPVKILIRLRECSG